MKNWMRAFLVFCVFALPCEGLASNRELQFEKARIYLFGWGILTRRSLSVEDVKRSRSIYIEVESSFIHKIVDVLETDRMESIDDSGDEDARLVIELVRRDGTTELFVAGEDRLVWPSQKRARWIDLGFRKKFTFCH